MKCEVWRATERDVAHIVKMGRLFRAASSSPIPFDAESAADFAIGLIQSPTGIILVSKSGMIGGALAPAYFNSDWVMAVELAWWATDRSGLVLLAAFEDWARENDANEIRMTTLASISGPEKIVTRRGYQPAEISYQKVI